MELCDIVFRDGLKPAKCMGYVGTFGKIRGHIYYREKEQHPKSHGLCDVCKNFYLADAKIRTYKKNEVTNEK